jgi:hypothetical protein
MLLCEYVFMRTTIDLPDDLFRQAKATAALRGSSMKELVIRALAREFGRHIPAPRKGRRPTTKLPVMPWKGKKKLDLTNFNFDDLLS